MESEPVDPLSTDDYYLATRLTQIISVDLIIHGSEREVLVGRRKNAPAKNSWFVPGGRVYKYETMEKAIERISEEELGFKLFKSNMEHVGVYDHIYPDNFVDGDHGTHYLAHGFRAFVDKSQILPEQFQKQHVELKWVSIHQLLENPEVHEYTKNYFRMSKKSY